MPAKKRSTNYTTRLTGDVKVDIRWSTSMDQYVAKVCVVKNKGSKWEKKICKRILVGPADADRWAGKDLKSPEAFDSAARAAIAFAEDEKLSVQPDYDDSQIVFIGRPGYAEAAAKYGGRS